MLNQTLSYLFHDASIASLILHLQPTPLNLLVQLSIAARLPTVVAFLISESFDCFFTTNRHVVGQSLLDHAVAQLVFGQIITRCFVALTIR